MNQVYKKSLLIDLGFMALLFLGMLIIGRSANTVILASLLFVLLQIVYLSSPKVQRKTLSLVSIGIIVVAAMFCIVATSVLGMRFLTGNSDANLGGFQLLFACCVSTILAITVYHYIRWWRTQPSV